MLPQEFLDAAHSFAIEQANKFHAPSVFQIEYTNQIGQRLAKNLNANSAIVLAGTNLMDCMLGKAYKLNRLDQHVTMSHKAAMSIIKKFPEITDDQKANILMCIDQHHGVKKFYSMESEICCNADCYRFISIEGFLGSIAHGRFSTTEEIKQLFSEKSEEKWNALSLSECKKELKPQYQKITNLLNEIL